MAKFFTLGIMGFSEVSVSLSRIQNFLLLPERVKAEESAVIESSEEGGDFAIELENVTTHWGDKPSNPPASLSVDLQIPRNTLCSVIGPVGSGKSALLLTILKELQALEGKVTTSGTVSYAQQQPFIISATIEQNITFGEPLVDRAFYDEVIEAVGLDLDLKRLRDRDQTIVGDRGVNLSGGQKARISLARAIFAKADIVLLDDILSAVDVKVARKIYYVAIKGILLERLKSTVVLVTHQHQFCSESENILMVDGKVVHVGGYLECIKRSNGVLTATAADDPNRKDKNEHDDEDGDTDETEKETESSKASSENDTEEEEEEEDEKGKGKVSVASTERNLELRETGRVKGSTFRAYMRAMGAGTYYAFFFALSLMLIGQAALIVTVAEIGKWSELPIDKQGSSGTYALIWGLCSFTVLISFARSILSFNYLLQAARYLHDKMTATVLRAKISFFDTHPLGMILNRFSADVGITDDALIGTLFDFFLCGLMTLGSIVTAAYALPIILASIPFLLYYFVKLRSVYITASRELKRIESMSRSPVFTILSEAMSGLSTLRAFPKGVEIFARRFEEKHDENLRAFFAWLACTRWLGFRLDIICLALLTCACYLAVVFRHHTNFNIDPAILGLALMFLIQLAGLFQWSVRQSAEAENQMISVERILQFSKLDTEDNLDFNKSEDDLVFPTNWPATGKIVFKCVSAKYRPELERSLEDVSFVIKGGERVGIVGRTGSGKSTLLQVLMRLLDEIDGTMEIDGIDTAKCSLARMRRSVAVIPQTPTLFSLSLRQNLDPFDQCTDEMIWDALKTVQMGEAVKNLGSDGLNYMLAEGGSNFSVGQQQLLCLCRAILRKSQILVMDESAANIDHRTDKKLQEAVTQVFADSTIISIAHRLDR